MAELKITKLNMFDGMELKEASFSGRSFPDHYHETYSLAIIEQGIERLCYGKKEVLGHAHSVLIANPYEIHAHGFFDKDVCKYRAVYIPVELMMHIQQFYGLKNNKMISFPQQVLDDIYLFFKVRDFHTNLTTNKESILYEICAYLLRKYAIEKPETHFIPLGIMTDAAAFFKDHLPAKLNIEHTASRYGMDKFKFIRAFKKQTGLTPVSYLLLHRINKAKQLINTNMPLVEVALETGFYDQSHFIHYFKKYVGISPLVYKNSITTLH